MKEVNEVRLYSLNKFETHSAIMVWTLPESGFVVFKVQCSVSMSAPVPFSVLVIDEVLLYVLPAVCSFLQCLFVSKILVDIEESYHGLCLYPPV